MQSRFFVFASGADFYYNISDTGDVCIGVSKPESNVSVGDNKLLQPIWLEGGEYIE